MGCYLADMQLISKCYKGIKFLLCTIDLFSKYASFVPLGDKKGVTIFNAFQNFRLFKKKTKQNMFIKAVNFITALFRNC